MKSKTVTTITSNEEYVRMRIFDGDLKIEDAAAELLRIEQAQYEATRHELARAYRMLRGES
jgi:hypothetical protein